MGGFAIVRSRCRRLFRFAATGEGDQWLEQACRTKQAAVPSMAIEYRLLSLHEDCDAANSAIPVARLQQSCSNGLKPALFYAKRKLTRDCQREELIPVDRILVEFTDLLDLFVRIMCLERIEQNQDMRLLSDERPVRVSELAVSR